MLRCPLCRDLLLIDREKLRLLCPRCLAFIPFDMMPLCN